MGYYAEVQLSYQITNKGFEGIRGTALRTKFPQNILLFDNKIIFSLFFSITSFFISRVLIFKHKSQTNRSSVIARLFGLWAQALSYV